MFVKSVLNVLKSLIYHGHEKLLIVQGLEEHNLVSLLKTILKSTT